MIYFAAQIYLTTEAAELAGSAYAVGHRIALHFGFTAYLLCTEGPFPDHWRRVRDEVGVGADAGGSGNPPSNFPFMKKFWWMVDIAYSVRMAGWVQEPRDCLPPPPSPSRRTFLWKTSLKLIRNLIILDLLTLVFARNPVFDHRVHGPTDGPETYLAAIPLLRRAPYVLAFGLWLAHWFKILHDIAALVCVALGCSSPALWPDVWGRWGDAYTVRKLWGCVFQEPSRLSVHSSGLYQADVAPNDATGTNPRPILLQTLSRGSHTGLDALRAGKTCREQDFEIPSWYQSIVLHPTLHRFLPLRSLPLCRGIHVREADGPSLLQILPPPSRRHNSRRLYHLYCETLTTPQWSQTRSRESRRVLGRSDHKGCGLLLGDLMVLFDVAGIYRWCQPRRVLHY